MLLYTGPPKFRLRDIDATIRGQLDFPLLVQLGVYVVAGVLVGRALIGDYRRIPIWRTQKAAIVFLITLAFSTLVSSDRELTLFKAYQFTIVFLFAGLFLHNFGVSRTLQLLVVSNAVLCGLVVAAIPFLQTGILEVSETGFPRLRGSAIAETALVGPLLFVLLFLEQKRGNWLVIALASLVTFFSLSRTSWGCVVAVLILIVLCRPQVWSLRLSRALCIALVCATLMMGAAGLTSSFRDAPTSDLTGRTEIWTYTTAVVLDQSPWRGLGYAVASRTLVADIDPNLGGAHSIFVDVFLGGGFISLAVLVLLYILMGIDSVQILLSRRDACAFSIAALFVVVLIMSMVGGQLDLAPFGFTFFCLVWMLDYVRRTEVLPASSISSARENRRPNAQVPASSLPPASSADAGPSGN